jgi:hypothetical protein
VLLLAAWLGRHLYRRYGESVRAQFAQWMGSREASVADVMAAAAQPFRPVHPAPAGAGEVIDLAGTRH